MRLFFMGMTVNYVLFWSDFPSIVSLYLCKMNRIWRIFYFKKVQRLARKTNLVRDCDENYENPAVKAHCVSCGTMSKNSDKA